jgi:hypothetical protein
MSKALCSNAARSRYRASGPKDDIGFPPITCQLCVSCSKVCWNSKWLRKTSKLFSCIMCPYCWYTEGRGAKPFRIVVTFESSDVWLFGLKVVDLGNSRKKSVSPGQLSRKPIELRSDDGSGVVALGVLSSGLEAAANIRICQPYVYTRDSPHSTLRTCRT